MKNKLKILMIGPSPTALGGISSVINTYEQNNLFTGEIEYLSSYKSSNLFFMLFYFNIFLIKLLFKLIFNRDIKIIHIQASQNGSFCRKTIVFYLSKLFAKKVILHIHSDSFDSFYSNSNYVIKKIIISVLKGSDLILALSEIWQDKINKIAPNTNIIVLHNPVNIKECNHKKSEKCNILFMGRLGKRKGIYDIIKAAKYIKSPNIVINIYGDGDITKFKNFVTDNNLQDRIKINGWVSGTEKEKVFKDSNVLILPSYNEGLPISILEAMAYGLPVISTPVGGIPEAVINDVNGFLIQAGDFEALAEKIDVLAGNKQLAQTMGQESYRIAKEKFDTNVIISQLSGIYMELLK